MIPSEKFLADYQTLTASSGYVLLEDWSRVTMTGKDRQSFLHNMCTNDIRCLSTGTSCEAFCTNVQGKIVAPIFVIAREDRLELLAVPGQATTIIEHLDRYIIREDVVLTDATRDAVWIFISDGKTASAASGIFANDKREDYQSEYFHYVQEGNLGGVPGSLLSVPATDRLRMEKALQEAGGAACCQEAWKTLRIESKLPLFGIDFDHTNLPQEVDRDAQAIHFNKGCYLGQETIARIDALGHVNQKVVLLKFAETTVPPVGLKLYVAEKKIGRVTSSCWSPRFEAPLALAMVRRGSNALGSGLKSEVGVACVIAPFAV